MKIAERAKRQALADLEEANGKRRERIITPDMDEKGQYKDSAEHWLSMWRQATSEAKEAQE